MLHGSYGEFKILLDGETILDGGAKGIIGIFPSSGAIVETLRGSLSKGETA
jgi:hypothetical protein